MDALADADTIVVPGGSSGMVPSTAALDALRAAHTRGARVARHIAIAPQREGDQAQFIVHPEPHDSGSLEPTMRWLRDRLAEPVTLAEIADHAAVSPRTLSRWFRAQTGTTPLRWLLRQRVHRAQELLETTGLSIEDVAVRCGFGTSISLRQRFAKLVHTTPQAYRRAFRPRPPSRPAPTKKGPR